MSGRTFFSLLSPIIPMVLFSISTSLFLLSRCYCRVNFTESVSPSSKQFVWTSAPCAFKNVWLFKGYIILTGNNSSENITINEFKCMNWEMRQRKREWKRWKTLEWQENSRNEIGWKAFGLSELKIFMNIWLMTTPIVQIA